MSAYSASGTFYQSMLDHLLQNLRTTPLRFLQEQKIVYGLYALVAVENIPDNTLDKKVEQFVRSELTKGIDSPEIVEEIAHRKKVPENDISVRAALILGIQDKKYNPKQRNDMELAINAFAEHCVKKYAGSVVPYLYLGELIQLKKE